MKKLFPTTGLVLITAVTFHAQQSGFPKLTVPYLGQRPLGPTLEVFAPEILTSGGFGVHSGKFSPDGREFYYYRHSRDRSSSPRIMFTKEKNGLWTEPSEKTQRGRAAKLSERLSVFEPFIGPTWVGSIPNDSQMGEITLRWEVLLNGFAVRLSRHILKFDHWLETTYFWDESSEKIAYLALSNNGVVIKGYVAVQGEELISEGDQRGPDVNRKVRRIYRLDKSGKLYEDDQFRIGDAGEWRRTHVSVFIAK